MAARRQAAVTGLRRLGRRASFVSANMAQCESQQDEDERFVAFLREESHVSEQDETLLMTVLEKMRVFPSVDQVEAAVEKAQGRRPGASPAELSRAVVRRTTTRMTGIGVVTALPGAIPGVGTAVEAAVIGATFTGETWALLRNLAVMQLTIAGLHGYDLRSLERRDELLIVLGLEAGAIVPIAEAAERVGTKVAIAQFNSHVSGALFKQINKKLGTTVLTKWGTKRGGVAVGQLIPFGVGSAVGGGVNFVTARAFGAAALRLYTELLPGDADVLIVE
jgi:hypothetical protein